MSRDLRNTYYHVRHACIVSKHPDFSSQEILVTEKIKEDMQPSHTDLLRSEFLSLSD